MNPTRWGLLLGVLMVFLGLVRWLTGEDEVTARDASARKFVAQLLNDVQPH